MKSWNELRWWNSPECEALHTKLDWYNYTSQFYPHQRHVYRALHLSPFEAVRVVIVGQDPYHTPGLATGLAFSVPRTLERKKYPPSLVNIFQELVDDLGVYYPRTGDLSAWAGQGILLWNSVLTVAPYQAGSHRGWGWESLTKEVITSLITHKHGVVFVLWGKDAQKHLPLILPSVEEKRHHVVMSSHPSPLSADKGFLGSRPFSTVNAKLKVNPIDWRLT